MGGIVLMKSMFFPINLKGKKFFTVDLKATYGGIDRVAFVIFCSNE